MAKRMTAENWAELAPELVRDEYEAECDQYSAGLSVLFAWLEANQTASIGEALIALADLNPDAGDADDVGREAERLRKLLAER